MALIARQLRRSFSRGIPVHPEASSFILDIQFPLLEPSTPKRHLSDATAKDRQNLKHDNKSLKNSGPAPKTKKCAINDSSTLDIDVDLDNTGRFLFYRIITPRSSGWIIGVRHG